MKLMGNDTIIKLPRTAMDVFEMLPEGTLAEVINNIIYMSPAPLFYHQETVGDLFVEINSYVKFNNLGKAIVSPIDVYFDALNVYQPDIIFIAKENLGIVQNGKIKGSPDITIEVLWGDKKFDLVTKKKLYEKFGVKEYFVVHPTTKEVNSFYLVGKKYEAQPIKTGKLKSKLLKKVFSF